MKKLQKGTLLFLVAVLVLPLFFLNNITTKAVENDFKVNASAGFAVEAKSGKILFNQNGDQPLPIASMTKIISIYLVMEAVKEGKLKWEQKVPIDDYAYGISQNRELSNVPLRKDDTYTVKELYEAMSIYSANGADIALAQAISGSEPKFVDKMQKKVKSWGIKDAKLINATGLTNSDLGDNRYPGSNPTDENMMSAKDVAVAARHLLNDFPEVLETSKIAKKKFREGTEDEILMENWNWMLPGLNFAKENVDGLKTGTTDLAGACFTGTIEKDGTRIITVIMHANDQDKDQGARFIETGKLMDYVFNNWTEKKVYAKGDKIKNIGALEVEKGKQGKVDVVLNQDAKIWVRKDMDAKSIQTDFKLKKSALNKNGKLEAPLKKGDEVGEVRLHSKQDSLGYLDKKVEDGGFKMIVSEDDDKANVFTLMGRGIKEFFVDLFQNK